MLNALRTAFLNVFRNARRTALTLSSMMIGFMALACFGGFIEFSFIGLRENIIRTQLGHIQIYQKGYAENYLSEPEEYLIPDPNTIETAILALDGVETVAQRLEFSGLATVGLHSVNVSVVGIDPRRNDSFADFETLVEGRQIRRNDTQTGVVGSRLMTGMGANLGDWVTLVAPTVDGIINAVDFELVGSVSTGSQAFDEVFAKVPLELAQTVRDTDKVESIIVLLNETDELPQRYDQIVAELDRLGVAVEMTIWSDVADYYHRVVALYTGLFNVFAVIVGIVVMFSVANTVTMSVMERTSEVGALRAIGATRSHIVRMFLLESIAIGLLGVLLGAAGSVIASEALAYFGGITVPPPPGMSQGYQAQFLLTPKILAYAAAITFAAAVISSIYPAWAGARFKIVDALEHT